MSVHETIQGTALQAQDGGGRLQPYALSTTTILTFIAMAIAWSCGIGLGAQFVLPVSPVWGTLLAMVSGFGRSLAGITVDALINTPAIFRSWLARCLTWPIDWRRYAVAFGLPPAIMLLAGALAQEAIDVAVVLNALRALGGELGRNDHLQPPPIRSPLAPTTALPFAPQYQRGYP